MASGFIILRDGRCLSVRHKIHDAVLRSIAAAMDATTPLHSWLRTQVPEEQDIELGFAFVRSSNGDSVCREMDIRGLTTENQKLFECAGHDARPVAGPYAPIEDVAWALNRLREMLRLCDEGRPPLTLSDWKNEAPPCERRIGPGWTDSD